MYVWVQTRTRKARRRASERREIRTVASVARGCCCASSAFFITREGRRETRRNENSPRRDLPCGLEASIEAVSFKGARETAAAAPRRSSKGRKGNRLFSLTCDKGSRLIILRFRERRKNFDSFSLSYTSKAGRHCHSFTTV